MQAAAATGGTSAGTSSAAVRHHLAREVRCSATRCALRQVADQTSQDLFSAWEQGVHPEGLACFSLPETGPFPGPLQGPPALLLLHSTLSGGYQDLLGMGQDCSLRKEA